MKLCLVRNLVVQRSNCEQEPELGIESHGLLLLRPDAIFLYFCGGITR